MHGVRGSRLRRIASLAIVTIGMAITPVAVSVGTASASTRTALVDASTVSGGSSSKEATDATAAGFAVTVVSDATWATMTAAQFASYGLLIVGDPGCGLLPPGVTSSASVWGPVVMGHAGGRTQAGNRVLIGTDPVFHAAYGHPNAAVLISTGIAYAGAQPGTTGMYFDDSCAAEGGQQSQTLSSINALTAYPGHWSIDTTPPCGGNVSLIASVPQFSALSTSDLAGWSCSVHESFPTFPTDYSALAVATDTSSHPTCGIDPNTKLSACGEAYVLISGSSIVVTSGSIAVSPADSTNPVGTSHTVTANVTSAGSPLVGKVVTFTVTGQNAGATGTCVPVGCASDSSGNVSFTYADANGAGDDTIKASFTDAGGSLQAATAQEHWVGVAESITASGSSVSSVEGAPFGGPVATVTDTSATSTASEFTATTNWGDSSISTDTVTGPTGGPFIVSGSHTYAEEGSDTATTTVTDTLTPSINATAKSAAMIGDALLTAGAAQSLTGVEGGAVSGSTGTFSDANPAATTSDFTATITWGDGSSSIGTVTGPVGGLFSVDGNHTYAEEGSFVVRVIVSDIGGSSTALGANATVNDAAIVSSCATTALSGLSYAGHVASLTDANPAAVASDFTATINWGDNSSSTGTVSVNGGSFDVSGSHTYASAGNFSVTTTVADDGGSATSTSPCSVLIYAGAPGGGTFVVGNNTASGSVTFWGAHWSKVNSLSGGAAPASFKGYAASSSTAACGGTWTTSPGNSATSPLGQLPSYMSVIVSSITSQSGAKISGNAEHVVVVKTAAGYANDPGHAGTGTVVATIC